MDDVISSFMTDPGSAAIVLDFDGTLAPIVRHPAQTVPADGAVEVLTRLVRRFAVVDIVSGRRSSEVRSLLPVPGLRVDGVYGLEGTVDENDVRSAAAELIPEVMKVQGAWVELKGPSVAIHFRESRDPNVRERVHETAERVAEHRSLEVFEGKRVWELAPPGAGRKGAAIDRLLTKLPAVHSVLYAGDDIADLEAFDAVDRFAADAAGRGSVRVCVRSEDSPAGLIRRADVSVDGPPSLIYLLDALTQPSAMPAASASPR